MTTQTLSSSRQRLRSVPSLRPAKDLFAVAPGVAGLQTVLVNLYFVGTPGRWVLVDAGIPMNAGRIRCAAERRFGPGAKPEAIILTHGHFDHVGSLQALAERWDVPIYA